MVKVQKHFLIDYELNEQLEKLSKASGISQSELLRRGLVIALQQSPNLEMVEVFS